MKRRICLRKWLLPILLIAVIALLFQRSPDSDVDRLTILSMHQEGVRIEHSRAFRQWYKVKYGEEIDIEWLDMGGTSAALRYVLSSFKKQPEGIGVDIFFGGGIDPYITLKEAKVAAAYRLPQSILNNIPPDIGGIPMYDKDYFWYGANLASFGILINNVVLERVGIGQPASWDDLARPEYFSWIGSGDPRQSGSTHMMYEIILQAYGWNRGFEIIMKMGGNISHFTRSASQTVKDVTLGESACGLAIDAYAYSQIALAPEGMMEFVLPVGATIINPDAIAILNGAPHRLKSERFIEFCLSHEGQKLWVFKPGAPGGPAEYAGGKMSVRKDMYSNNEYRPYLNNKINPFELPQSFNYDSDKGSARWDLVNRLVGTFIIDDHREHKKVWRNLIDAGLPDDLVQEFCTMPMSEDEAMTLLQNEWKDLVIKDKIINRWINFNRNKLNRIQKQLDSRDR
jgi:iron(III) transport system substrate-binding protein